MATYHVKTGGSTGTGLDDTNAWSFAHFLTRTFASGDVVNFKKGDTFSGTIVPQSNVTYGSYGSGAKPIITGLTTITGWVSIGGGLYEKTLSTPPTNSLNMVLFDGALQPIGRYPKAGLGEGSYFTIDSFTNANTAWTNSHGQITSSEIASIPNFVGGELVHRPYQWIFDRSTVTAQTSTTVNYTSHVAPDHPTFSYAPINTHGFFFQNHINCLTTLGDWAYNQTTKKITMYFGAVDPATRTVQVAITDVLCTLDTVTNITVQDISFKGSNESAVFIDTSTSCDFINAEITFAGKDGIEVDRASFASVNNITTEGCLVEYCHNNGINFQNATSCTSNNGTIVRNIGMIAGMGKSGDAQYMGICRVGTDGLVEYNEVYNVGYNGISFAGSNTIIQYCHVHHFCMIKSDGGGIYTYGDTGTNRLVHKNIVHDGTGDLYGIGVADALNLFNGQVHGIYMDSNTESVTITDNTSFNNINSGIFIGSAGEITATGNILFDNKTAQINGVATERNYSNIVLTGNTLFSRRMGSLAMNLPVNSTSLAAITSNNNRMCRPLWEPNSINSNGYTTIPLTWYNHHDGAVIYVGVDSKFKSLDVWKTYSSKDAATTKTFMSIADDDEAIIEYNATNVEAEIDLEGINYYDLDGTLHSGTITIPAYSSAILLFTTDTPVDLKAYANASGQMLITPGGKILVTP